jgi:exopolysaccharide biosynthesis WecB/TagA/CpsF family protein
VRLLNVEISDQSMDDVLAKRDGTFLTLHTNMLGKLQQDKAFHDLLPHFDFVTCDSQVLCHAAKWILRTPVPHRVSGSDYFARFCERYRDDPSVTIFLCGAMPGVAERAQARLNERAGRRLVVGTYSPPKGFEDDADETARILAAITESGATVLLVGLGTPKENHFIVRHRADLPSVRLFLPLGGTIDYEAGEVKRPPAWVTRVGLEWAYRLVQNPRQRARRYLLEDPPMLWQLLRQRLGRYTDPFG